MSAEDAISVYAQPMNGYRNWKRAMTADGIAKHVGITCSKHKISEAALVNLTSADHDVMIALQHQSHNVRQQNRERVKVILDVCLFLARQGLPFRGHDEADSSNNRGSFLELAHFTTQRDPEFSQRVESAANNAKYNSPLVRRQLIQCAADTVRSHVFLHELGDGRRVARPGQSKWQLSFVLCGKLLERFLVTICVKDTCASSLLTILSTPLPVWGLSLSRCRGQGYDGAANMAGDFHGLQQRVRNVCPYAHFVHCFVHRLNLVLVAVAKNTTSVVECLDRVQGIHVACTASCRRKNVLRDAAAEEQEQLLRDGAFETGRGLNQPLLTLSVKLAGIAVFVRCFGCSGSGLPSLQFYVWLLITMLDFENQADNLRSEATRFGQLGRKDGRFFELKTTEDLSVAMTEHDMHTIFPTLYRLVCLASVLPVTTASTERSFSMMRRVKTRLRTTLGHELLSNLLLLGLEADLTSRIDKDAVIDTFGAMTERRIAL